MLYEGGIREPMIVKWPGVTKPGSVCRENVIGVDFYPTCLGYENPCSQGLLLDGLSLVPLLENPQAKLKRKAIYWHFPLTSGVHRSSWEFPTTPAGAVRMGDWKLIEFFEDGTLELYNTRKDISETKNLAKDMSAKVKEMHQVMLAWRKDTKAPVPTKLNPATIRNPPSGSRIRNSARSRLQELVGESNRYWRWDAWWSDRSFGRSRPRSSLR